MKQKFNPKQYQGKDRIYRPIKGYEGVLRIFVWNAQKVEYQFPENGKICLSRRWELNDYDRKVRVTQYFDSIDEARSWRLGILNSEIKSSDEINVPFKVESKNEVGILFKDVILEWKARKYPLLAIGTCDHYDQLLKLHFRSLMHIPIREINSKRIDCLIVEWKRSLGKTTQSQRRTSFKHELTLLGVILNYYREYHEDDTYVFPIKNRHRSDVKLRHNIAPKSKDMRVEEFFLFREELAKTKNGSMFAALATTQFFQALRASEAAGLFWEDVNIQWKVPSESKVTIRRYAQWSRARGRESQIALGFKNAKANGGFKELPMFPETFEALKSLYFIGAKGLVFQKDGTFLKYRQIQHAYDNALKRAGLPYTGTHIMRHGGCQNIYNETGDLEIAGQLLGNQDLETIRVYAKRQKSALKKVTDTRWEKHNFEGSVVASGRIFEGV